MASPLSRASAVADWPACACGCGKPAPAYKQNDPNRGKVKGSPAKYIKGHSGGPKPIDWTALTVTASGCHVFTDYKHPHGWYRRCRWNGEPIGIYKMLWIKANGTIPPPGYDLHHRCENKACVNVDHLVLLIHGDHNLVHGEVARQIKRPNPATIAALPDHLRSEVEHILTARGRAGAGDG